jgi:hypothetical protein
VIGDRRPAHLTALTSSVLNASCSWDALDVECGGVRGTFDIEVALQANGATRLGLLAMLLVLLAGAAASEAHGINSSYIEITVTPARIEAAYLLTVDEIVAHFPVAPERTDHITPEELDRVAPAVFDFLARHLTLSVDDRAVVLEPGLHRAQAGGIFIRFEFSRPVVQAPAILSLATDAVFFERFDPRHVNFVRVDVEGEIHQAVLTLERPRATFSTGYRPRLAQFAQFVRLGIAHIFHGYDHLMFLIALIIVGGRLRHVVAIVTAFTVAHSLTLALATLHLVTLPARLIEGGIALTIAYVAFENVFGGAMSHRWLLTFGFGLVHGFGFATVLREMTLPASQLIPSLVSFNVGVEIGQVAIVAALYPVTRWLARQRFQRPVLLATSGVIFLSGAGWFLQHAFDLSFMPI